MFKADVFSFRLSRNVLVTKWRQNKFLQKMR